MFLATLACELGTIGQFFKSSQDGWTWRSVLQARFSRSGPECDVAVAGERAEPMFSQLTRREASRESCSARLGGATLRAVIERCAAAAANLVFPPSCLLCGDEAAVGRDGSLICPNCLRAILAAEGSVCRRCAAPSAAVVASDGDCARCRNRRYHFQEAVSLGLYRGRLREAVLRMKQAAHEPLAVAMGRLLATHLRTRLARCPPDLLTPIPMHWTRRLLRGADCAGVLAESVSRKLGVPAAKRLLSFRRKVKKQGTLLPAERFRNVRGALCANAGYDIKNAHVLVVDDVMTTGATASEAAKVLRERGAKRVSVAVIARGVGLE